MLLLGVALSLLCCAEPQFSSCVEKNRLALTQSGGFSALAVDQKRLLVPVGLLSPAHLPKEWQLLLFDPLTGFAVVSADHALEPAAFRKADRIGEHPLLSIVEPGNDETAALTSREEGLCGARLDKPIVSGAVVCAPCYAVMGVGMLGGFIESDYLRHLIDFEGEIFQWGDLGFRFYTGENRVRFVNPFLPTTLFCPKIAFSALTITTSAPGVMQRGRCCFLLLARRLGSVSRGTARHMRLSSKPGRGWAAV